MLWPNHDISGRNVALTNQLRACNVCIKRVPSYVVVRPGYTLLSRLSKIFSSLIVCLRVFISRLFLPCTDTLWLSFSLFVVSLQCYLVLFFFSSFLLVLRPRTTCRFWWRSSARKRPVLLEAMGQRYKITPKAEGITLTVLLWRPYRRTIHCFSACI